MVELFIHMRPIVLTLDAVVSFLNAHMSILYGTALSLIASGD